MREDITRPRARANRIARNYEATDCLTISSRKDTSSSLERAAFVNLMNFASRFNVLYVCMCVCDRAIETTARNTISLLTYAAREVTKPTLPREVLFLPVSRLRSKLHPLCVQLRVRRERRTRRKTTVQCLCVSVSYFFSYSRRLLTRAYQRN